MNTQSTPKFDLYQDVTNRIIEALEAGTAPWLKPWKNSSSFGLNLPKNAVSNRLYSGVNILLLWLSADKNGYKQSKWITARAANELGGHVRKGEKATLVVSYRPTEREKLDDNGNVIIDENGNPEMEKIAFLNKHYVFNIEQCEKLPAEMYDSVPISPPETEAEQYTEYNDIRTILKGMELNVNIRPSNRAYYCSNSDTVTMPEKKQFNTMNDFYSTLLHEIVHATGHKKRLDRVGISSGKSRFGNKIYAFEELIAEMGSAFLCAHIGFNTVPQNASYIDSWIKVLKEDKRAIFKAAGKARNACDYMLDTLKVERDYQWYYPDEDAA
ncbi:ArdC family protein [Conservatibacter flavescens]|uniref:Antirestriction protein n=1 Tax=Conservatibacter flavescens TaxID=28161 RepID=A0A2M8S144_9PAST|nr:zincin-like metallopeptidase domain-containing protein [Conservatibacter flavescens]PJG84824.1 antirestriction protein [Conservatibacter flavescens]